MDRAIAGPLGLRSMGGGVSADGLEQAGAIVEIVEPDALLGEADVLRNGAGSIELLRIRAELDHISFALLLPRALRGHPEGSVHPPGVAVDHPLMQDVVQSVERENGGILRIDA